MISSSYIAGKVEITQGIKNGDKIITRGFLGLNNGKSVKVSGEKDSAEKDNSSLSKRDTSKTEIEIKPETKPARTFSNTLDRIWNKILDTIKS